MSGTPMERRKLAPEEWTWNKSLDPPFHKKFVNPVLTQYYARLFSEGETGRVVIPLCGKSLDIIFFADKGHEVVGVEFSEIGVEDFFTENNLTYSKSEAGPFVVYKANEKNITIYRGDFFQVNEKIFGKFDALWDRGSFVAVNVDQRTQYTDVIFPLMKPKSKCILEFMRYDVSKYPGPPHYVTEESLQETYGRRCNITLLGTEIKPVSPTIREKSGMEEWTVGGYLLEFN